MQTKTFHVTMIGRPRWYAKPLMFCLIVVQHLIDWLEDVRSWLDAKVDNAITVEVVEHKVDFKLGRCQYSGCNYPEGECSGECGVDDARP